MRGALRQGTIVAILLAAIAGGCSTPRPVTTSDLLSTAVRTDPAIPKSDVVQASFEQPGVRVEDTPGTSVTEEEEYDGLSLSDLAPSNMKKQFMRAVGKGPNQPIAQEAYRQGEALMAEKKYEEAAEQFGIAASRWPDSMLEEDALFMAAECYFFADEYPKTIDAYKKLLKKYESSRHLDKMAPRMFAIGRYWDEMGKDRSRIAINFTDETRPWFDSTGGALAVYNRMRLSDPTGPLADDAAMAAANNYFVREHFDDSARMYDVVRKEYPQSEYQPQAHMLSMRSRLEMYQGPSYDATSLHEADEILAQTVRQFGRDLPEERERLAQMQVAIRAQKAERDWLQGEYYRKLGYNRAARMYYDSVLQDYGDTRFAELARQRVEEIKDLPPEPKDHFAWLTRLFGDSRK